MGLETLSSTLREPVIMMSWKRSGNFYRRRKVMTMKERDLELLHEIANFEVEKAIKLLGIGG